MLDPLVVLGRDADRDVLAGDRIAVAVVQVQQRRRRRAGTCWMSVPGRRRTTRLGADATLPFGTSNRARRTARGTRRWGRTPDRPGRTGGPSDRRRCRRRAPSPSDRRASAPGRRTRRAGSRRPASPRCPTERWSCFAAARLTSDLVDPMRVRQPALLHQRSGQGVVEVRVARRRAWPIPGSP